MLESQWQTMTSNLNSNSHGWVHMADLSVLSFTGSDVRGFLQGYFTSDVMAISTEAYQPSAICNLQGRVSAFGWARAVDDNLLQWLVPESVVADLRGFLKPYLAFSKTTLAPVAEDHLVLARVGESGAGDLADTVQVEIVDTDDRLQALFDQHGTGRRDDIDMALIDARVPWLTANVAGRFLPQMLGLVALGAVSFDKGCYLGQEVVAPGPTSGPGEAADCGADSRPERCC